jgi:hypothetical protein
MRCMRRILAANCRDSGIHWSRGEEKHMDIVVVVIVLFLVLGGFCCYGYRRQQR